MSKASNVKASSEAFERGREYVEEKAKNLVWARSLEDLAERHKVFLSAVMLLRVCFPEREATIGKMEDLEWELFLSEHEHLQDGDFRRSDSVLDDIKSGRGLKILHCDETVRSPRAGIVYEMKEGEFE